jgi:Autographiviridae endonuclease
MTDWLDEHMPSSCIEWEGRRRKGYGNIRLPDGKSVAAHRVAWEQTYGPIPAGMLVLHHCDNPPCVNPEHLFLGTDAEPARPIALRVMSSPRGTR